MAKAPAKAGAETSVLTDVLWVEKYRPRTFADMALEPDTRQVLQSYLDAGEIPHLLLVGPSGSGKTTAGRILFNGIDAAVLTLNASSERGIDVVREKIGTFAGALLAARWNVVFLDEADAMTSDAQTALRNLIESFAERTRFILTANYGHRIIAPIQSRCQLLTFDRPPLQERFRILGKVLTAEGIPSDVPTTLSYAEKYPDLRQMLNGAQRAYLAKGSLPPAQTMVSLDGAELLGHLEQKNWRAVRNVAVAPGFDATQVLRELFYAVPDEHPHAGRLRHILGRGVHETGFTPDPIILFLAVCAEAMEGL